MKRLKQVSGKNGDFVQFANHGACNARVNDAWPNLLDTSRLLCILWRCPTSGRCPTISALSNFHARLNYFLFHSCHRLGTLALITPRRTGTAEDFAANFNAACAKMSSSRKPEAAAADEPASKRAADFNKALLNVPGYADDSVFFMMRYFATAQVRGTTFYPSGQ